MILPSGLDSYVGLFPPRRDEKVSDNIVKISEPSQANIISPRHRERSAAIHKGDCQIGIEPLEGMKLQTSSSRAQRGDPLPQAHVYYATVALLVKKYD